MPGVSSNTLKNRNTVRFRPPSSLPNLNVYINFVFNNLKSPPPPHPPLLRRFASHNNHLLGRGFSPLIGVIIQNFSQHLATLKGLFDTPDHVMEIKDVEGTHKNFSFYALFRFIQPGNFHEVDAEGMETIKSVDALRCL
jgi:hypothetical protein